MTEVKEKHPEVIAKPYVCDFDSLIDSLRKGKIEFAIGLNDPRFSEFDSRVLHKGNFGIYTFNSDFKDGLYVDNCSHPYVHLLSELYKGKYKKPLKIIGETNSWELVVCFVENNLGCGFFPDFLLTAGEKAVKLVSSKLPKIPYEIAAFFLKGQRLTKGAQVLLAFLETI